MSVVLQTIRDHSHFFEFPKGEFMLESVKFLGHVVSKDNFMADATKIEAIHEWSGPIYLIEVCSFICLLIYCKWFRERCYIIEAPMTILTQNKVSF